MNIDFSQVSVGDALPPLRLTPTLADAVMYSAAMWEFQKIHFDDEWSRTREGLQGAILQGPALGNHLSRMVMQWVGERGRMQFLNWRNHGIAPLGETLTFSGQVTAKRLADDPRNGILECELVIHNPRGQAIVSATAGVQVPAAARTGAPA